MRSETDAQRARLVSNIFNTQMDIVLELLEPLYSRESRVLGRLCVEGRLVHVHQLTIESVAPSRIVSDANFALP